MGATLALLSVNEKKL